MSEANICLFKRLTLFPGASAEWELSPSQSLGARPKRPRKNQIKSFSLWQAERERERRAQPGLGSPTGLMFLEKHEGKRRSNFLRSSTRLDLPRRDEANRNPLGELTTGRRLLASSMLPGISSGDRAGERVTHGD